MLFQDNNFNSVSQHLWRVWVANARASIVREMEFRTNFLLSVFRQLFWAAAFIFFIEMIFRNTTSLSGWNKPEMLVILSLSRIIEGIIDTLFSRNIAELPSIVQNGEFDFNLIKPGSAQFYTAFRRFHFHNLIGHVGSGVAILVYALSQMGPPSPRAWLYFSILFITSLVIFYSILILLASLVFVVERLQVLWSFLQLITEPLTVPFDVFPRAPRIALTYILPIAFIVFVPAQALTNRLSLWQLPVAVCFAIILLIFANLAWRAGLRRYSSASS